MKFLRLIRIENIIMVILTQLLMSKAVIAPILRINELEQSTPFIAILLLILGTALISMGGYVINDYFDTRIDEINKPGKVVVGKTISRHKAMQFHQFLTISGVICGLYVAWQTRSFTIAALFVFIPGLLWFYSSTYKRQFFIGNLIVATITACVPFIIAITEGQFLRLAYGDIVVRSGVIADIYKWVGFFAIFAFTLTILREMVKDLEDEKGDRELECRTVPIVFGAQWTKVVVTLFTVALIVAINYVIFGLRLFVNYPLLQNFLLYGVCAPLVFFIMMLFRSNSAKEYALSQSILKFIMIIGVLFSVAFAYSV